MFGFKMSNDANDADLNVNDANDDDVNDADVNVNDANDADVNVNDADVNEGEGVKTMKGANGFEATFNPPNGISS